MLNMAINIGRSLKYVILTEFKLQIQFVTFIRGHPRKPMLGPAVNRQPGFRRGTRRAKQRSEEQCLLQTGRCCNLAADLPDQLTGHRFAAVCRPCCRLGSLAASSLSVVLSGSPG